MNYGQKKYKILSDGSKRPTFRFTKGEDYFSIYGDIDVEIGEEEVGVGVPVRITPHANETFWYVIYGVNDPTESKVLEGYLTVDDLRLLELGM